MMFEMQAISKPASRSIDTSNVLYYGLTMGLFLAKSTANGTHEKLRISEEKDTFWYKVALRWGQPREKKMRVKNDLDHSGSIGIFRLDRQSSP